MFFDKSIAPPRRPVQMYTRWFLCASLVFGLFTTSGMSGTSCSNTSGNGGNGGNGNGNGSTSKPTILSTDHVMGDPNAPVTVVEYGQFDCPFCIAFERNNFPTLKANYIDTGKVRFVFRHFPFLQRAMPCAVASECGADQVDFFTFANQIWAVADPLNENTKPTDADLMGVAVTLGLDTNAFNTCFGSTSKNARVNQDLNSGKALGVSSTPTFFIDGESFPKDANDIRPVNPTLFTIIDQHLGS